MNKAELRYIDGDYYITIGDKKISVDKVAEPETVAVHMPDGSKTVASNYDGNVLFQAACILSVITLDGQEPGGEGEETG